MLAIARAAPSCANGTYRLEFFAPHMDENGYRVKETAGSARENVRAVSA